MPYVKTVMLTVQFAQDEILLKTRLSQIPSYLFRSGRDFPVQTFTDWCHWSGRPIMDESGVGLFLVSSSNLTKLLVNTFTSSISEPVGDKLRSSDFKAWISPRESLSRITLQNPNSNTKDNALWAASASISSALHAWGIFCEQEAKTAPLLSRITTPISDILDAPKIAPSKFIFTNPASGHLHLVPPLPLVITWTFETCKFSRYCVNTSFACSATWWSKTTYKCRGTSTSIHSLYFYRSMHQYNIYQNLPWLN